MNTFLFSKIGVFVFLKSITTIPTTTKAYKLGLIDRNGKLIRNPKTQEEHNAISNLDLIHEFSSFSDFSFFI